MIAKKYQLPHQAPKENILKVTHINIEFQNTCLDTDVRSAYPD